MHTFTFQSIADHIQSAIDAGRDDLDVCGFTDLDDDETIVSMVEYYLSEARETTFNELRERGFDVDHDAKTITIRDAATMSNAQRLTAEIAFEYDATKPREELPTNWWTTLSLGGDDDVDYNGSYLDTIFDIVEDMLPEDHRSTAEGMPSHDAYHLPADVIEANVKAYREQFYKDNPEALVRDTLRARVHDIVKLTYPTAGLVLNVDEFQLYHDGAVYRAPRADNGPWLFAADGREVICIREAE